MTNAARRMFDLEWEIAERKRARAAGRPLPPVRIVPPPKPNGGRELDDEDFEVAPDDVCPRCWDVGIRSRLRHGHGCAAPCTAETADGVCDVLRLQLAVKLLPEGVFVWVDGPCPEADRHLKKPARQSRGAA